MDETPPPNRATSGPRHGDPRISAEDMIAEALVAAGLRAPNVRTYNLNSPEAHRALCRHPRGNGDPPYPDRPCRPRPQSDEVVRPWTDVVVPRGVNI